MTSMVVGGGGGRDAFGQQGRPQLKEVAGVGVLQDADGQHSVRRLSPDITSDF